MVEIPLQSRIALIGIGVGVAVFLFTYAQRLADWRSKTLAWILASVGFVVLLGCVYAVALSLFNTDLKELITPQGALKVIVFVAMSAALVWSLRTQRNLIGLPGPTKRENSDDNHRAAIALWRAMVTEIQNGLRGSRDSSDVTGLLESHPAFPSLRPHLSERTKKALFHGRTFYAGASGSTMPVTLTFILEDIDKLEEKWGVGPGLPRLPFRSTASDSAPPSLEDPPTATQAPASPEQAQPDATQLGSYTPNFSISNDSKVALLIEHINGTWLWKVFNGTLGSIGPGELTIDDAQSFSASHAQFRPSAKFSCSLGTFGDIQSEHLGRVGVFARRIEKELQISERSSTRLPWPSGDPRTIQPWLLKMKLTGVPGEWPIDICILWNAESRALSFRPFSPLLTPSQISGES